MANRVNSNSLRYDFNRKYQSRWFLEKQQRIEAIINDHKIRETLIKFLPPHKIGLIEIERLDNLLIVTINTSAPGLVIGKDNSKLSILKKVTKPFVPKLTKLLINVNEIDNPATNPELVAHTVAEQLENRVPFRIVQKQAIKRAKFGGVKGIKIIVSGRLAGADIARSETYSYGSIPLQTFKAQIGYAATTAKTTYGIIGVKVWIYSDSLNQPKSQKKRLFSKFNKFDSLKPKNFSSSKFQSQEKTSKSTLSKSSISESNNKSSLLNFNTISNNANKNE